jgi:fructoselysine 3-epimerase
MAKVELSQFAGMNEHFLRYPLHYFLDAMVELEIQNIELWAGSPHLYIEDLSFSQVAKIRQEIESRNLNLICYTPEQCVYPINIAAKESSIRDRSINYYIKSLEAAAELGTNMFQIVPGWGYFNEPKEEAWKRCREALSLLTQKAESLGILITLEPLETRGTNLITNVTDLKNMLNEVNLNHLKGIVDTGPMAAAGESFDDYFRELGEDIRHIHFVDSGHRALGDGTFPLSEYLHQIGNHQYKGYLSIEICARQYFIDPKLAVKKSLDHLKSILSIK